MVKLIDTIHEKIGVPQNILSLQ